MKTTLFETVSFSDDYINSRNSNEKITVFENKNHIVIVSREGAFISTNSGEKHLKDYKAAIKFITNHIVCKDKTKFYGISFQAKTTDYVKRLRDVENYIKDIRIDRNIIQQYNKERSKNYKALKEDNVEFYKTKYVSDYYSDIGYCSRKEVEFATAEYYNDIIGRITTTIEYKYLNSDFNSLSKINFIEDIEKLKERQFEMFMDCFNQEYISTIL